MSAEWRSIRPHPSGRALALRQSHQFERRQMAAVRKELDQEYEAMVDLNAKPHAEDDRLAAWFVGDGLVGRWFRSFYDRIVAGAPTRCDEPSRRSSTGRPAEPSSFCLVTPGSRVPSGILASRLTMRLPYRNRSRFDVPGRAGLLCPSFRGCHVERAKRPRRSSIGRRRGLCRAHAI